MIQAAAIKIIRHAHGTGAIRLVVKAKVAQTDGLRSPSTSW